MSALPAEPAATTPTGRKRVLVLGGGFAGVEAASDLGKSGLFDVTLVSDRDYLYLFPITVWIPVRGVAPAKTRVPLRDIAGARGFAVVVSAVESIDREARTVRLADRELDYDYLVVALGAGKMKHPGIEHTLSICGQPEMALHLRDRLDTLVARGSGRIAMGFGGNPKDTSAVRGGPAFEMMFNVHEMLKKRGVRDKFELTFFAPMPSPGERMGPRAVSAVDSMFTSYGIATHYGTKITGFDEAGVAFEDGSRIDADLVMFIPAGAGHPVLAEAGFPLNEAGFVAVDDHGLVEGTTEVYAAGDIAAIEGPPWRAKQGHVAEAMGRNAAYNIIATEEGRPERKGYQEHLSIICLMDTGTGGAMVYRDDKRASMVPLPIVGHWMKKGWGTYSRLSKTGKIPHLPGM